MCNKKYSAQFVFRDLFLLPSRSGRIVSADRFFVKYLAVFEFFFSGNVAEGDGSLWSKSLWSKSLFGDS